MTTTAPTTTPKPRRRWLQFSLQGLVAVASSAVLFVGSDARGAADRERDKSRAIAELQTTAHGLKFDNVNGAGRLSASTLSRPRTGTCVAWKSWINCRPSTSKTPIAMVAILPTGCSLTSRPDSTPHPSHLRCIDFRSGLVHIAALPKLRKLTCEFAPITDDGLVPSGG